MDDQDAGRTRSATGARHQASWPPADDPGYPDPGQGTVPRHAMSPGTGAQQQIPRSGTGAHAAPARTPMRGFPPVNPVAPGSQGRGQPEPVHEAFSPWHAPGTPPAGEDDTDPDGYGYDQDADHDQHPPGGPADHASIPPGTHRHGTRTARIRGPRRRPRIAWLAVAAVVVLAAGGLAGYKYLYEPRVNAPVSASLRLPTTAPGSPEFDQALGRWQHIGTRAEDPAALTLTELFPPGFVLNGASYTRTVASATTDCTLAVYGSQLQAALQSGHCTQVLRASYISGNGTMMGTVGVANLRTASEAQSAGQATGPQQIIAPLSSSKGPTAKLGTGTGVVQAEIKGHYLILMWAEFANLKSPSTSAQRQLLEQFAANLVTGSANIELSTRMLTGKP